MDSPFIVAEVNKNWHRDRPTPGLTLHDQFERLLRVNWSRGYKLHSWSLKRCQDDAVISETVVAIFVKRGSEADSPARAGSPSGCSLHPEGDPTGGSAALTLHADGVREGVLHFASETEAQAFLRGFELARSLFRGEKVKEANLTSEGG